MSDENLITDILEEIAITGSEVDPDQVPLDELLPDYSGKAGLED